VKRTIKTTTTTTTTTFQTDVLPILALKSPARNAYAIHFIFIN